jgi:hypothetical protein
MTLGAAIAVECRTKTTGNKIIDSLKSGLGGRKERLV